MLFGPTNDCKNKEPTERTTMNTTFQQKPTIKKVEKEEAYYKKFVEKAKAEEKEKPRGPEAALVEKKANKMTRFSNCDILLHNNDVEVHGFEKTKHIDEMELLAVKNDCRIIIKNGTNGKWYLKGKGKPIEYLKSKIDERLGKSRDGVYCYLLEF